MSQKPKQVVLRGQVATGIGEGQYFTTFDWVRQQFLHKFGFVPIPGTFNVKASEEDQSLLDTVNDRAGTEIVPPSSNFCSAKCFPVRVETVEGVLVIPIVKNYPRGLLEIMAPVNMRQTLGVGDNDTVKVLVRLVGAGH